MRYALVNCDIYTGENVLYDKGIIIKNKEIDSLLDIERVPKRIKVVDLNGMNIAPCFIDLQVNGGGGCLFEDPPLRDSKSKMFYDLKYFRTCKESLSIFGSSISKVSKLLKSKSQFGSNKPRVTRTAWDLNTHVGISFDEFHVYYGSMNIPKKSKRRNLFFVTDSIPLFGPVNPEFNLGDLIVICKKGAYATDDVFLASILNMAIAVRKCIQKAGISTDEALRMASTYPAECLGLGGFLGMIRPGYLANMTVFDNQLVVKSIIIEGKKRF
jgi:N-acetylglucosamine-6-phosphate deacetylase